MLLKSVNVLGFFLEIALDKGIMKTDWDYLFLPPNCV